VVIKRDLPSRVILTFIFFSILGFLLLVSSGCSTGANPDSFPPVEEVQIGSQKFSLELALTPEKRAEGLMGREKIADNGGMLFVFPDHAPYPTELSFWMKNCLVPIDLIFIDPAGKIIAIHEMTPPPPGTPDQELTVYRSGGPAQYAIEIKGGLAAELGLQVGDHVELRFDELLKMAE
jgi:uncharacterized protein